MPSGRQDLPHGDVLREEPLACATTLFSLAPPLRGEVSKESSGLDFQLSD